MTRALFGSGLALLLSTCAPSIGLGQERSSGSPHYAPQARPGATNDLARFDGLWVGTAELIEPSGSWRQFAMMERIGPLLAGEIRVMEGKASENEGTTLFNAFTVFSAVKNGIEMRSWTPGHAGTRLIEPTPDGYDWRTPAGPGVTMVYRIHIRKGVWHETGERVIAGQVPTVVFRMTLRREGSRDWPSGNSGFPTRP